VLAHLWGGNEFQCVQEHFCFHANNVLLRMYLRISHVLRLIRVCARTTLKSILCACVCVLCSTTGHLEPITRSHTHASRYQCLCSACLIRLLSLRIVLCCACVRVYIHVCEQSMPSRVVESFCLSIDAAYLDHYISLLVVRSGVCPNLATFPRNGLKSTSFYLIIESLRGPSYPV
jgi:hypothetical protein